jgi:DnaJ family protein C protein 7
LLPVPSSLIPFFQGGDEEKFKLVVEANAVLSDARRRERYDLGEDEDGLNDGGGMGGPFAAGMRPADLEELFSAFGGGGAQFGGFGGPFGFSGGFSGGRRSYTHG